VRSNAEAQAYLAGLGGEVRLLAEAVHRVFVTLGCESYVKTIYIGYEIDGEMVAAAYSHADHVEVALALPEDVEGDLLVDATHLTWRTLPVAALVRRTDDLPVFESLATDACDRVRSRAHDIHRDNEFFVKSAREHRSKR
jgi:hypothetical protein